MPPSAKFLSATDRSTLEALGGAKLTKANATKMADYLTKGSTAPSTRLRKLSALRDLMRAAGASKDAITATMRPELTIEVNKKIVQAQLDKAPVSAEGIGTLAELTARIEAAGENPELAVKSPQVVIDLALGLSARPGELAPGGLTLVPRRSGRRIVGLSVRGILKKRGKTEAMELVSGVDSPAGYKALYSVFNAFRALNAVEQAKLIRRARTLAGKTKHTLKDMRNLGAAFAVLQHAPDGNASAKFSVRARALRHAVTEAPVTLAYSTEVS